MKKPNVFPDDYIGSVYDIDFQRLHREGCRAVIFDVDNTLVPHGAPADGRAVALFSSLHAAGLRALLLSNNREPRVKRFAESVIYTAYIHKAGKPSSRGYKAALQTLGVKREEALFVGDQLFTDIWGANRAGIRTCLVKPVLKWREEPQIILKRFLEAPILLAYRLYRLSGGFVKKIPLRQD